MMFKKSQRTESETRDKQMSRFSKGEGKLERAVLDVTSGQNLEKLFRCHTGQFREDK